MPAPVFAPSAAVGTIVAAIGQRVRRTAQTLIGVVIGILIGDALLYTVGPGPVQVGLAVGVAIAFALILSGGSGAVVAHAGASAVVMRDAVAGGSRPRVAQDPGCPHRWGGGAGGGHAPVPGQPDARSEPGGHAGRPVDQRGTTHHRDRAG
ncbi:FUSC family protein [Micromonospora sp. NPDC000663]|uniref:FUSC family protein n=1 Tax=Micromonospora sp. NPDC000663 TaxID=3364218 RepID=UPI0036757122